MTLPQTLPRSSDSSSPPDASSDASSVPASMTLQIASDASVRGPQVERKLSSQPQGQEAVKHGMSCSAAGELEEISSAAWKRLNEHEISGHRT